MGSPLGPLFANYYMCHLENKAFNDLSIKTTVYTRYVDDCFLVVDISELHSLKNYFEQNSCLKFTYETEINKKIPFLDVNIRRSPNQLETGIYTKLSTTTECLNYQSICPLRYKIAVIKSLVHRALSVVSSFELLDIEIKRIEQVLVNNGFPIGLIKKTINNLVYNSQNNVGTEHQPSRSY